MQVLSQGASPVNGPGAGPSADADRGGDPAGDPSRNGAMRRVLRSVRDAVERLFSPHTTSEQLLDALHKIEGIRTAADNAERQWLEAQLRQAQKLETVGQLAGGIAHDFNNILAVILANTEMLTSAIPADRPDLKVSLEKIHAAARGGTDMVRGLLGFSRRADLSFSTLDLREVVAGLGQMVRPIVPDNVEMRFAAPEVPCPVRADGSALQQILLNLVTNARDAMASGGTLTIEVTKARSDESFPEAVPWVDPDVYYCVAVSDTGVGMDQATVDKVFEPFFTTKALGTGTGLGMAMVYGLTKQHGGFVHVLSEPGVGTVVKVYLPRSPESAPERLEAAPESVELIRGHEAVLLVEDKAELRGTTRRVLERLGYTVIEANDGEDGLEKLRENLGRVDLILSDVVMPRMAGPELYRAAREVDPAARFLFTSGYNENDIAVRSLLDPGVLFVAKPWTIAELARQIRKALEGPASAV
jgi:two-component system cell cycle sensor histidine kinase/response regulator CckA